MIQVNFESSVLVSQLFPMFLGKHLGCVWEHRTTCKGCSQEGNALSSLGIPPGFPQEPEPLRDGPSSQVLGVVSPGKSQITSPSVPHPTFLGNIWDRGGERWQQCGNGFILLC